ncbi:glycoside hydrolase family 16 protein [Sporobolomyces koalae]|uniref:glycoside hydrolase family 16 protein n=1 Tax=Sporobolomyces koalae TaxID=500713 RepID=UPI0031804AAF
MHPSTLTVLSFALLAVLTPGQVTAGRSTTLSPRSPIPEPAAQAQRAPLEKPSRRRRAVSVSPATPASSNFTSEEQPLVKPRQKRRINPKPRRVPINPKFAKRSVAASPTYTLSQASMGGYSFFDDWDWFTYPDPTHGWVDYRSMKQAWGEGLVYVPEPARNTTIMRVDSWTDLSWGKLRGSVRISSKQKVDLGSIVVADIANIPHGPAVWPAFWMVGDNWPYGGEVDLIEGVHDSTQNQMTLHTAPGCTLTTPMQASGAILATDCNAFVDFNIGCGVQDTSKSSYGSGWNDAGGGVSVTQFDETGISIWSFLRDEIPDDITNGTPNPAKWGTPKARWEASSCDMSKYFASQNLVFDITLGGDWAGATFNAAGYSGTWQDAIMDPSNFEQAFWEVNYVKVYSRT